MDMSKDTLFRGEFEVVKDLIGAFTDGDASKRMCDKVNKQTNKQTKKQRSLDFPRLKFCFKRRDTILLKKFSLKFLHSEFIQFGLNYCIVMA